MRCQEQRRPCKTGFTLTEILVVLVIIAILSAITFGVYSRVNVSVQSHTCRDNLKQMALAMQQYLQDNNGWYPKRREVSTGRQWPYALEPYLKAETSFRCPYVKPDAFDKTALYPLNRTNYTYNIWRLLKPAQFTVRNEAAIVISPSATWLNACDMPDGSAPPVITSRCGRSSQILLGTHHFGGTNWSFVDGHVKWMTPQQLADLDCINPPLEDYVALPIKHK